jgi:hypothetical protein
MVVNSTAVFPVKSHQYSEKQALNERAAALAMLSVTIGRFGYSTAARRESGSIGAINVENPGTT